MTNREFQSLKRRAEKLKPKPTMLPSGTWRCQTTQNGKHISATGDTPEEAHQNLLLMKIGQKSGPHITVRTAISRYISAKDVVLSPSTIAGYKKISRNYFQEIMDISIEHLSQEIVQKSVNDLSKRVSPKTVRNAYGLLTATLNMYGITITVTLPAKQKNEIQIPSKQEIEIMLLESKNTNLELPILLATEMGMRTSEIRGLTWDCIVENKIHIKQAIVDGENGPQIKGTKSYSGDRWITMTPHVKEVLSRWKVYGRPSDKNRYNIKKAIPDGFSTEDFVCIETRTSLHHRFSRLCQSCGIQHYRFHDLRHYHASVLLALGIPDKYAMERMGHATNNMLKNVYQHTMEETNNVIEKDIAKYFSSIT